MADELEKKIIVSVSTDTGDASKDIDDLKGKVDNLNNAKLDKPFKSFKAEIKEATIEAKKMEDQFGRNSTEFTNAAKRVADLRDKFGEFNQSINAFNPDNKLQAFVSIAKGATGAVQGVTGAMQFLGVESGSATEAIAKLQGLMAFSDSLNSIDDIKNAFSNFNGVIQSTTIAQKANAAATTVTSAVMKALGISTEVTSFGFKALKGAIIATGIGALAIGLVALVQNFDAVKEAVYNFIPGLRQVGEFIGGTVDKIKGWLGITEDQIDVTKALKEAQEELAKSFEPYFQAIEKETKLQVLRAKAAGASDAEISAIELKSLERKKKIVDDLIALAKKIPTFNFAVNPLEAEAAKVQEEIQIKQLENEAKLAEKRRENAKKAADEAKKNSDKAAEQLKSEREKLKAHEDEIQKITKGSIKAIADTKLTARQKELADIDKQFQDEDAKIQKAYDEQLSILKAELKRKAITKADYDAQVLAIDKNASDAVLAIQEEKGVKTLEVEKKYNQIIGDFINGYQETTYQQSRKKLIADFDEKIKVADEKQKELLEKLKEQEVGQLDQTETLRKNTINSETNLITVQSDNQVNEEDSVEVKKQKLQNIFDAEKEVKEAQFQLELERLGQQEEEKALLRAKFDADNLSAARQLSESKKAIDNAETEAKKANIQNASNLLGNLSTLAGKQSAAGKAFAIAQTTIDTYQSAVSAYKSLSGIPIVGPALGAVAAAAAIKSGFDNVKRITAVQVPGGGGNGSAPAPTFTAPTIESTALNPELTATRDVRVVEQPKQVIKAYITNRDLQENKRKQDYYDNLNSF